MLREWLRRQPYLCWAHGEELTTAAQSRELAFLIKRAFSKAAAVFANSQNTRRSLEDIGIPAEQIAVIHPGVDVTRFHPETGSSALRKRLAPNGETLVVTIARLQRRKGHDHAIQALRLLLRPGPHVRYMIAGDGGEWPRLEALARELDVGDAAVFTGKVPETELTAYYTASDIFLHPTRVFESDTEGLGIVFLEAQATGKPVVGGCNGSVPETTIEGETGLLVSGEDVEETAAVLLRLVEDPAPRSRMGAAGRRHVASSFSWERAARAVAGVQHQVLAARALHAAPTALTSPGPG
jgi:phosphatidylinositol alpha-1,6-mannosyltransferase